MPIYQYRCKCGNTHDEIKRGISSADDCQLCPVCGDRMARVMGGVVAIYKGQGFYNTDYKGAK